jgi:hypothetical protein
MPQTQLLEVAAEVASQTPVADQKEVRRPGAQMIADRNIFHTITSIGRRQREGHAQVVDFYFGNDSGS